MKKIPIRIRFWASSITSPPRSVGIPSSLKWTSGSSPAASRRRSHARKPPRTTAPAAITNGVSEKPKGSTGELSGLSQPQLLACSTPMTISARPIAESTLPTQSSLGLAPSRSGSDSSREPSRIAIATSTSPTNTTRQLSSVVAQPPRMGPTAIPAPAMPPSTP